MIDRWHWIAFNAAVVLLLALDLGAFRRRPRAIGLGEALGWSAIWIGLAGLFALYVGAEFGRERALAFTAGYLIEESLSVDNLFVFAVVFAHFRVPRRDQHRVLLWGIAGALVLRGITIGAGSILVRRFDWLLYLFGVLLIVTSVRLLRGDANAADPANGAIARWTRRWLPIFPRFVGSRFFVRADGRLYATPLLLVLVVVEISDLLFALDSIPAVFAVSRDPFIVYTSNICAVLGLRSLYFALAALLHLFHHLKIGIAIVLAFVGAKMLLAPVLAIPTPAALGVVASVLALSVAASLVWPPDARVENRA